jgi:hypothetical protein
MVVKFYLQALVLSLVQLGHSSYWRKPAGVKEKVARERARGQVIRERQLLRPLVCRLFQKCYAHPELWALVTCRAHGKVAFFAVVPTGLGSYLRMEISMCW